MPNWVSTIVKIKAENEQIINDMVKHIINEDDELDFNNIIPMPEDLRHTEASTRQDDYIIVYATDKLQVVADDQWDEVMKKGRFSTEGRFFDGHLSNIQKTYTMLMNKEISDEELDDMYAKGAMYVSNMDKYGCRDWYVWSLNHWGTKWNACDSYYDVDGNELTLYFNTAWSVAEPIIWALVDQYDIKELECTYCDEDCYGGNCGRMGIDEAGDVYDEIPEVESEPWEDIVEFCWGYRPSEEEEW